MKEEGRKKGSKKMVGRNDIKKVKKKKRTKKRKGRQKEIKVKRE